MYDALSPFLFLAWYPLDNIFYSTTLATSFNYLEDIY